MAWEFNKTLSQRLKEREEEKKRQATIVNEPIVSAPVSRVSAYTPPPAPVSRVSAYVPPSIELEPPERSTLDKIGRGLRIFSNEVTTMGLNRPIQKGLDKLFGEASPEEKLAMQRLYPEPETKAEQYIQGAGEFAGSLVPIAGLYSTAGKAAATRLIPTAAESFGANLARNFVPGAVAGGIYEGGKSAIEGNTLGTVGKDTLEGAAMFGAGDAALWGLGKGLGKAYKIVKGKRVPIEEAVIPDAMPIETTPIVEPVSAAKPVSMAETMPIAEDISVAATISPGKKAYKVRRTLNKPIAETEPTALVNESLNPEVQLSGTGELPEGVGANSLIIPEKAAPTGNENEYVQSFNISALRNPGIKQEVKDILWWDVQPGEAGTYQRRSHEMLSKEADNIIETDPEAAYRYATSPDTMNKEPDLTVAIGIKLADKYQKEGLFGRADDILNEMADHLTRSGQTISAARMISRLSPEGAVMRGQKIVKQELDNLPPKKKAEHEAKTKETVDAINGVNGEIIDQVINEIPVLGGGKKTRKPSTGEAGNPTEVNEPIPKELPEKFEQYKELIQGKLKEWGINLDDVIASQGVGELKGRLVKELADTDALGREGARILGQDIDGVMNLLVGRRRDALQDSLATRIKGLVEEGRKGKSSPAKDMLNTLVQLAKQSAPKVNGKTAAPRNEMELIEQAILNKKVYGDIWAGSKMDFIKKYGADNPNVQLLEDFFNSKIDLPYAESQLDKAINQGFKDTGVNLGELVRQHFTKMQGVQENLADRLITFGKLPQNEAIELANAIQNRVQELGNAKKQQILTNIFKDRGKPAQRKISDKIIELSNLGAFDTKQYRDLVAEKMKLPAFTEEIGQEIRSLAEVIQVLPEGREREVATAQLTAYLEGLKQPTLLKKIGTVQTMAQLLNPKTAMRNLGGNAGFAVLENVSDVVGAGLDRGLSMVTGKRTKVLPSLSTQIKGAKEGFKLGLEDARLGIDTTGIAMDKFGLSSGRTFKSGPMKKLETALNVELRATDRAFSKSAYDESLRNQMAAAKVDVPTPEMMAEAEQVGRYRTFQDDNALSELFVGVKRILNGGKEFGAGDFIVKYPKTPANLLARGLDYSPAAILKVAKEATAPLRGQYFNQKAFVEAFSRGLVGSTGLFGMGAMLHKLGVITGKPPEDYDLATMQRQTGFGDYRINVTALWRLANKQDTKPRRGDTIVNYDWFQPQSIPLAIGADIDANKGKATGLVGTLAKALSTGLNAFADQPVMQGIETLFSGQELDQGIMKVLEGVPASFIPTLFNQIKQLSDNQQRETYDSNWTSKVANKTINKVPGAASTLPQKYGTLGQPLETYQDKGNTLKNVFLNPSFVNKYNPSPEAQMVVDVYNQTGDTKQVPRVADKKITVSGKEFELTGEEFSKYQQLVGTKTREGFAKIPKGLSAEEQSKRMQAVMNQANQDAKIIILKGRGVLVEKKGNGLKIK